MFRIFFERENKIDSSMPITKASSITEVHTGITAVLQQYKEKWVSDAEWSIDTHVQNILDYLKIFVFETVCDLRISFNVACQAVFDCTILLEEDSE
ncbi:hypothetical protein T4D_15036 [Trichinella pseudospiralis]|uniref:Uncharacterized protein n=1 Tax=Trichinella pseudospiralis TaxID=6337 RepID=A0A0V1FH49_TRIPS|nr:hypothetical protein T4D_15036 [Trichinella pseudospiralis]